jgi:ribosomal protein S9
MKKIISSGKRKTAIAKAVLLPSLDKREITLNNKDINSIYYLDKLKLEEPLKIAEKILGKDKTNFKVNISVFGGGEKSQISAARLALAKVIIQSTQSQELRKAFFDYDKHLLVADVRRKEAYKPGDSKARRKRQKSYR